MKNYEAIASAIRNDYPELAQMRVLEVGSDVKGGLLTAIAPSVKEIVGVNIVGTATQIAPNARFEVGDIRNLDFDDSSFDLIVSHAVFEHVQDFDVALGVMHRLLKPGAELSTIFGPIWSCAWGHHLWVIGKDYRHTYQQPPLLPPYCHLLMQPEELRTYLSGKVPEPEIEPIVTFVFESDEQNRMHHNAYLAAIEKSKFEVKTLVGQRNRALEDKYQDEFGQLEIFQNELTSRYGAGDYLTSSLNLKLIA